MALTGAKYQEASMGQYGSSFLDGDGDSVDLNGSSATRYICSITFITDVVFQEIQTLGGVDRRFKFIIFGRWDYVELHSGMCICYFAPV